MKNELVINKLKSDLLINLRGEPFTNQLIEKYLNNPNVSISIVNKLHEITSLYFVLLRLASKTKDYFVNKRKSNAEEHIYQYLEYLRNYLLNYIKKYVIEQGIFLTTQVQSELMNEITRLEYLIHFFRFKKEALTIPQLDAMEQIELYLRKPFDNENFKMVKDKFNDIFKENSHLKITILEKYQIVRALNLPKGHWFKCPNQHIYVITECGGAMEQRKCPEPGCNSEIGGVDHKLVANNELAPEMDNANYAAWSEAVNLNPAANVEKDTDSMVNHWELEFYNEILKQPFKTK